MAADGADYLARAALALIRRAMPGISVYLLRLIIGRFWGILGIIIAILMLENTTRLLDMVGGVDAPGSLLARMLFALTPEYSAIGILIALFLAIALTVRALSLTGEWQILSATGMSFARQLRAPMLLGIVATLALLAVRLELQPAGEATLDRIGSAVRQGELGMAIDVGTVVDLPGGGMLSVEHYDGRSQTVHGLFVATSDITAYAISGRISRDAAHHVVLRLDHGQIWRRSDRGEPVTLHDAAPARFATLRLMISADDGSVMPHDAVTRMARMDWRALQVRAARERAEGGAQPALAALAMRVVNALFCLILPIFGVVLGELPPRQTTGFGIGAGMLLIVVFLRGSAYVEAAASATPLVGASIYLALWLLLGGLAGYCAVQGAVGQVEQWLAAWLERPARRITRLLFGA